MKRLQMGRRGAFLLGSAISKLDHHLTRLFDDQGYDTNALSRFEANLDLIDNSVFSMAEAHERALVIEMH